MALRSIEIKARKPFAKGASFGQTGAYEQLDGTAHFAVDPGSPGNSLITDIELAPRDDSGQVRFSADFRIVRPVEPQRGRHRLLFDVVNRGRVLSLRHFNSSEEFPPDAPMEPGNGFLMRQGYTLAWCGWQHDVPSQDGALRSYVPDAATGEGPVTGRIAVTFQTNAWATANTLSDRDHQPYPAADLNETGAELTVREHDDGPATLVPRDHWFFGQMDRDQQVPCASHICLPSGFEPGRVYRVIYTTASAPVVGLGLLAVRDFVSYLRHADAAADNPCAGDLEHAYAFGASQSGRFLRHLLYLGLNQDENGRPVFDGIMAHIAGGRRGEFNQRFGQPSNLVEQSTSALFPFADTKQTDPETGLTDGLLSRVAAQGSPPKLFLTNTSSEYWSGHAGLVHSDLTASADIAPTDTVRIYHFSGTHHTPGVLPLTDTQPATGARGIHQVNWVDYRPLLRAALFHMDRWVSQGTAPPPSHHPRIDDGSAVPPENTAPIYNKIPGAGFPKHLRHLSRLNFGREDGITSILPPLVGKPYPVLVSNVDADGNEQAGVRLPDVSVPLATVVGWNLRHSKTGGPGQTHKTMGSTIPFPVNQREREESGDPRPSVEERYGSRQDYLDRVSQAGRELVEAGYLLEEDLTTVTEQAAHRYDLLQSRAGAAAAR